MVEGSAATSLRNAEAGRADTLSAGEYVRINGRAGRNNRPMISLGAIESARSPTRKSCCATLPTARLRERVRPDRQRSCRDPADAGRRPSEPEPAPGAAAAAVRASAIIARRRSTQRGQRLQAAWDPANDPQVACEDPTLIRQAGFTPHPARIEQFDDRVVISYEEYGGVREIYLDGRGAAQPGDEHVKLGRSTARYEGDQALIIESTHITAGPTGTPGNQLTDQVTTVETYRRLDDPTQGPDGRDGNDHQRPRSFDRALGDGVEEALHRRTTSSSRSSVTRRSGRALLHDSLALRSAYLAALMLPGLSHFQGRAGYVNA